jgi:hypothetical protein
VFQLKLFTWTLMYNACVDEPAACNPSLGHIGPQKSETVIGKFGANGAQNTVAYDPE